MTASIFIVTHAKHLPFLRLCVKSIHRHVEGFAQVVLVVPTDELAAFLEFERHTTADGVPITVRHRYEAPDRGHLWMNATKCCAEIYCAGSDLIAHIDADSVFNRPVTPESYLLDGQIIMATCPYAEAGDAQAWKPKVDRALGIDVELETMQSPILAYWSETYRGVRKHIEELHREPFTDHALTYHVAEFDTLGAYALMRFPARYAPMDRLSKEWQTVPKFLTQGWSHYVNDPVELPLELARLEAAIS
jgi:hypothetical protein